MQVVSHFLYTEQTETLMTILTAQQLRLVAGTTMSGYDLRLEMVKTWLR